MSGEGIHPLPQSSPTLSLVLGLGPLVRLGLGPRLMATQTQGQMGWGFKDEDSVVGMGPHRLGQGQCGEDL